MGRDGDKDDVEELRVSQDLALERSSVVEGDFPSLSGKKAV